MPQSIIGHENNYPVCIYYSTSSAQCFKKCLASEAECQQAFLMNFKPVHCWDAAWYDICHNMHSHRRAYTHRETEKARQQVCFVLKLMKYILVIILSPSLF